MDGAAASALAKARLENAHGTHAIQQANRK